MAATARSLIAARARLSGEAWNPGPWQWFFEQIGGGRCPIINYSGGTEISGGILGSFTILPLKPTCFSAPVPGMAVDVVDDAGNPVRGAVGELVLRGAWPGMTRGFWQDTARYVETYWSRIPGLWVHGDFARVDDDGFWYILGRSDDTIKVAGKRVGPAEVESAAVSHPAVQEAAAIGVPHAIKGETIVAFVVLRAGQTPSEPLRGGDRGRDHDRTRQVAQTGSGQVRHRAAEDAQREGDASRHPRPGISICHLGDITALENPSAVGRHRRSAAP